MTSPALVQLLRGYPGSPEQLRTLLASLDVPTLVAQAARDGISGLVWHAVSVSGTQLAPEDRQRLQRDAQQLGVGVLRVKRLLLRALDALAAARVKCVLLKGLGLSTRYYPEPLARATSDVDLMVAPKDVDRAVLALTALGLRAPVGEDRARQLAHTHHLALQGEAGVVELHFQALNDFGSHLDAEPMLAAAVAGQLEGRQVFYLKPEHELVQLAAHASHHAFSRLTLCLDLKLLLLAHPSLDWREVVLLAQQARMPSAVFFALHAARWLGAPVPEERLAALAPGPLRRRLLDEVLRDDVLARPPAQRKWLSYLVQVALHESLAGQVAWVSTASRVWLNLRLARLRK